MWRILPYNSSIPKVKRSGFTMRKRISFLLAVGLMLTLTACGGKKQNPPSSDVSGSGSGGVRKEDMETKQLDARFGPEEADSLDPEEHRAAVTGISATE